MAENLKQQIVDVRKQISQLFSTQNSPSVLSPITSPKSIRSPMMGQNKISKAKYSKPKQYLSLPSISIHRNPMSLVSERDFGRQKRFVPQRNLWKGDLAYILSATNSENDTDWDKVIKTCRELIRNRT